MTENERLTIDEIIEHCNRKVERFESFSSRDMCENWSLDSQYGKEYWEHRQVANYLEELLQFRAIGTVEQLEWCKDASHWKELFKDKLEQYEAIGTIEEFRDFKEKNTPMELAEHNFQDEVHHYLCPSCRNIVNCNQNYCEECGQALET